jgi:DNA helicase-2/ATP-dependent DNA helicase PcrA
VQTAEQEFDYLSMLNPAQRLAAEFGERIEDDRGFRAGPLLVIAGAGTGKTMTLAHRVAHLVIEGVDPERILLLTFTRRAAEEMTRRVENIVRASAPGSAVLPAGGLPWAGTFHSIANRLLRRFARNLGLDPGFSVLDRGDAADMLDVVRHELRLSRTSRRFPKKDTCLAIYSRCVNAQKPLADIIEQTFPWCADWSQELAELFRSYVDRKQQNQSLDYDDLLLYWMHLVNEPEFAEEIGSWFDHILVDEYQDTNILQAQILHALKPDGSGLTVVGDDAQSIYSFRSAEVENILGFPDRYMPAARVVTLEQNYRSTQAILDAANCLIAESERQYRKDLFSERGTGARPQYVTVEDGDAEAEFAVDSILANRELGMQLKDQAVLFRGSHHSDRLELELVRRNIPYVKYGGLKFLEAAHVKDLLSILKWAENPKNEVAAFRVLKLMPGMGPALAARCFESLACKDFSFTALGEFHPPAAAAEKWGAFCELFAALASSEVGEPGWQAQLTLARRWYQPHLERIYDSIDTREADLEQLELISGPLPDPRAIPDRADAGSPERHGRPCRGPDARRGLPDPVDGSFSQGAGMGSRLCPERHGRQFSIRVCDREARTDRRRTALTVCRDDPRQAVPVADRATAISCHTATTRRRPARLRSTQPFPDGPSPDSHGPALCGSVRNGTWRVQSTLRQADRRRHAHAADVGIKKAVARATAIQNEANSLGDVSVRFLEFLLDDAHVVLAVCLRIAMQLAAVKKHHFTILAGVPKGLFNPGARLIVDLVR